MPKGWADRIIMFSVIGLVAWTIIVLPAMQGAFTSRSQPTYDPATEQTADNAKAKEPWLTKDAAGFFTFTLFVVGSIQVALFLWQLWLIRESLDDAKIAADAAKEAADAAKEGAAASRESADTARLSMVASDRAYVHFDGCRWIAFRDTTDGHIFWRIRPRWINSGNTPTRELRLYAHYEFRDSELPADYSFTIDPTLTLLPAMLAPKQTVESGPRDYSGTDLLEINNGTKYFYIWGVARYRDVFPTTPIRVTKFCVQAVVITGHPDQYWHAVDNPVDIAFAGYHRHNCTDEDCDAQL